jgi:hypothetical protein
VGSTRASKAGSGEASRNVGGLVASIRDFLLLDASAQIRKLLESGRELLGDAEVDMYRIRTR